MRPVPAWSVRVAILIALMLFVATAKAVLDFIVAQGWPDWLEIVAFGGWITVLVETAAAAERLWSAS